MFFTLKKIKKLTIEILFYSILISTSQSYIQFHNRNPPKKTSELKKIHVKNSFYQ